MQIRDYLFTLLFLTILISCGTPTGRTVTEPPKCLKPDVRLSDIEEEVIREINFARTRPYDYAELIEQSGSNSETAQEAIRDLRRIDVLSPLVFTGCLALSAADHVKTSGSAGTVGHEGFDERLKRYITGRLSGGGENVNYGRNTARSIVMSWIIDENVPSRGHRLNILNKDFKSIGVAFGSHATYRNMCVVMFTYDKL